MTIEEVLEIATIIKSSPNIEKLDRYIQFLLSRIEELKQEKNDLACICASTIRKRKELEEGIEKFNNKCYSEHRLSESRSNCLKDLLKLIEGREG